MLLHPDLCIWLCNCPAPVRIPYAADSSKRPVQKVVACSFVIGYIRLPCQLHRQVPIGLHNRNCHGERSYSNTLVSNDSHTFRKLSNVRKLWEGVLEVREIRDVFTGREIVPKQYDVDHFIPWSFVMNDELWNLMPMESSLNSSKSNRLPKWNPFFKDFAYNQYILYGMIHENANIHKRFEVCYGDNLHSIWAGQELYRKGNTEEEFYNILEKNMLPVYESARRQGYEIWEY